MVTDAVRAYVHSLSWGANLGVLGATAPVLVRQTQLDPHRIAFFGQWMPMLLYAFGGFLVMVDFTRHLLLDQALGERWLGMYRTDGRSQLLEMLVLCALGLVSCWCW